MLSILAIIAIGALLLLAATVGGVWWRQERIAYQPPAEVPASPTDVRRIEYVAADDQPLLAYLIEPDAAATGILIAFHGNADLATWQIPWAREVARRTGWSVLLAEYRGYGGLGGTPSYVGIREDARATWRIAQELAHDRLGVPNTPFAIFGHSLGSAVASDLTAEVERRASADATARPEHPALTALVLQSPFTSARDMARVVSTQPVELLWKIIARIHYDTRARFQEITSPIWIAHGARDWLVPVSMGRELFSKARVPGRLLIADHAGHNDVAACAHERYWHWLADALSDSPEKSHGVRSIPHTETSG